MLAPSPGATPLKFLAPGWFSLVMGLTGLALAWQAAAPVLGDLAAGVALVVGALAAVVFAVLAVASLLRWQRYPQALAEDLRHPVRHAFVATVPVSLLLLASWLVAIGAPAAPARVLWWLGSVGQLWATVWVLGRWLAPTQAHAPDAQSLWNSVTPVLFIPVVGNVVAPLAGIALGHPVWSAAHFGIGLFFWPVALTLVLVRRIAHAPLPPRLLPTWFITLAPPSVVGLALLRFEAPPLVAGAIWGVGLFTLLWAGRYAQRFLSQPFALPFWALSFPLAAFTTLSLRLANALNLPVMQTAALVLLALTSIVIAALVLATVKGLRQGTLLAPEPAAPLVAATP